MKKLFSWIGTIFQAVKAGFRMIGQAWVAVSGFIIAVVTMTIDSIQWVVAKIPEFLGMVAQLVTMGQNSSMFSQGSAELNMLNTANVFFPLNETISAVGFLAATWLVATSIRTVKAWIPTLG